MVFDRPHQPIIQPLRPILPHPLFRRYPLVHSRVGRCRRDRNCSHAVIYLYHIFRAQRRPRNHRGLAVVVMVVAAVVAAAVVVVVESFAMSASVVVVVVVESFVVSAAVVVVVVVESFVVSAAVVVVRRCHCHCRCRRRRRRRCRHGSPFEVTFLRSEFLSSRSLTHSLTKDIDQ